MIKNPTFGTVDYDIGEVMLGYVTPITMVSTTIINDTIEVRGIPAGQDVVAKKTVFLDLDINNSRIDALVDESILSS